MSTMERILRLMGEKKASDVYLSANAPALIKINGQCLPINNQLLPPDAPKALLAEVLPPRRIEELETLAAAIDSETQLESRAVMLELGTGLTGLRVRSSQLCHK